MSTSFHHLKCHAIAGGNAAISWKAVALNEDTEERQTTTDNDDPSSSPDEQEQK